MAVSLKFASGAVGTLATTCLLRWSHRVGLHLFGDGLAIELTDRDIMVDIGHGRPVRQAGEDPVFLEDRDFIDAVRGMPNRIRCPYARSAEDPPRRAGDRRFRADRTAGPPWPRTWKPPMTEHRTIRSLGVEAPHRRLFPASYDEGPPPHGQVRLDTLYSGFSAGTELTFFKDTNPYLRSRWDEGRSVFVEGEPSARFPVPFLGYMEVARVTDSRTPAFANGDIVCGSYGHKSGHTADPFHELLVPLPDGDRSDPRHLRRADGPDRRQRHPPRRCRDLRAGRPAARRRHRRAAGRWSSAAARSAC